MRNKSILVVVTVVVLALVGAAGALVWHVRKGKAVVWRTGTVRKGDLTATITATGTVEPEEVVDVGAQVAGQLLEFGTDKNGKTIDYGSEVESNMLLAKVDGRLYKADFDLAQAQVESDKAGELQAAANLDQMKAKEADAEQDWKRAQVLGPSEALAPTTFDSYKATYEIAKANVALADAAVASAKAATVQAIATRDKAQETLDYCTILSPVKGVIIDRRVNIGETVVSSLNTPSLFLIAKDLTRIQVWVSVNEADIGKIHTNQAVTFTVDAFPNHTFKGYVNKVRLNATMTQNVVTYTVEVNTDNSDGKLLPYLTANILFLTGEARDAFLAPNAALRYRPSPDLIETAPAGAEASLSGEEHKSHRNSGGEVDDGGTPETGTLWVPDGTKVRPIQVKIGLTDGTSTEVQGAGLSDNMTVVEGIQLPDSAADDAGGANPFLPQFGRRGGPGGGGNTNRAGGAGGGGGGGRRGQ